MSRLRSRLKGDRALWRKTSQGPSGKDSHPQSRHLSKPTSKERGNRVNTNKTDHDPNPPRLPATRQVSLPLLPGPSNHGAHDPADDVVLGAVATISIPIELFPSGFDGPHLSVQVPWRDAPSKEVLDKIVLPSGRRALDRRRDRPAQFLRSDRLRHVQSHVQTGHRYGRRLSRGA